MIARRESANFDWADWTNCSSNIFTDADDPFCRFSCCRCCCAVSLKAWQRVDGKSALGAIKSRVDSSANRIARFLSLLGFVVSLETSENLDNRWDMKCTNSDWASLSLRDDEICFNLNMVASRLSNVTSFAF